MHSTLIELAQNVLCTVAFAIFLLPPGYLAMRLLNLKNMRQKSGDEQLLWSVALSIPLALLLGELLGRILPLVGVLSFFFVLALAAVVLLLVDSRRLQHTAGTSKQTYLAAAAALLLGAYLLLTLIDIQVGNRLFVPTVLTDWGVRIPLVETAIRGPIPPLNPLSALTSAPASPMRYYYFWYILCALPARLTHADPGGVLAASAVWAGSALFAVFFLALKYFVGVREQLRSRCLMLLMPMLLLGLDILPTIAIYLSRASNPYLDIEWWHADRTPALLTALVYAPHHIGGLVCCVMAYLILVAEPNQTSPPTSWSLAQAAGCALVAGACFAACVGDSTFIAFIFVIASLIWSADLIRSRQFPQLGVLAASGVFAWLFSRPFLHELKSGSSAAHGFAGFAWRSSAYVQETFERHHFLTTHPFAAFFARQTFILTLDICELGFLLFVAAFQIRRELLPALRGRVALTLGQRALWAIFFAASISWLFISSSVTSAGNDLGSHAGLLLRFILVLWSPPYLLELWALRHSFFQLPLRRQLAPGLATICLALGLAGGLFDAVLHRVSIPLFDAGLMKRPAGTLLSDHLGERFLAMRSAWRQLDKVLPPDARVQFDPFAALQPALSRYSNRQLVASDGGCGTAFGGNYDLCPPVRAQLRHLFDEEKTSIIVDGVTLDAVPETTITVADFDRTCHALSLSAVLVESTDPVWSQPGSWATTLQPAFDSPTIRAFLCPGANPLAATSTAAQ